MVPALRVVMVVSGENDGLYPVGTPVPPEKVAEVLFTAALGSRPLRSLELVMAGCAVDLDVTREML